jgi:hypothetical protein
VNTKELGESITIHAPENLISSIAGQKRSNINKLKERFSIKQISFINKKDDIIEIYNKNKRLFSFKESEVFQNYLNMQQGDLCI